MAVELCDGHICPKPMLILNMWEHDDGCIMEKWQSVVTVDERQARRTPGGHWSSFQELFGKGGGRHKHLQHLHVLIQEEVPMSSLLVL